MGAKTGLLNEAIMGMRQTNDVHGIGMTSQGTRDRLVKRLQERGLTHQRVLEAVRSTPRHLFIDEALSSRAYEDTALPIGLGQTISQPYIVARMTAELLGEHDHLDKVLEIGTGSGYQAAILSLLADRVFTLERIEALLRQARRRFHKLGLHNIFTRYTDGQQGWRAQAPFDGIIVTAACQRLPQDLVEQLAVGASLIAPVKQADEQQQVLIKVTRNETGFEKQLLEVVSFVPLLDGLR